jgi:hypothetical protein
MGNYIKAGLWANRSKAREGEMLIPSPSDSGGIPDAPSNNKLYGRENSAWVEVPPSTGGVPEAPIDNKQYCRENAAWTVSKSIGEAPLDGQLYGRENQNWTVIPPASGGVEEAPEDGKQYGRQSDAWTVIPAIPDLDVYQKKLVQGVNITINNTDPNAPIISAPIPTSVQRKLTQGPGIIIDNTNPGSPIISATIPTNVQKKLVPGTGITINNIDPENPVIAVSLAGTNSIKVTKEELTGLVDSKSLIPGVLYEISGIAKNLYNDGRNLGTKIFLNAIATDKLGAVGYGEFFNPNYDRTTPGFGIWSGLTKITTDPPLNTALDTINAQTATLTDSSGSAILYFTTSSGLLSSVSGNWVPGKQFRLTGQSSPVYTILTSKIAYYNQGDYAIWGGYVWRCYKAGIDNPISKYDLDPTCWAKQNYDTVGKYTKAIDVIEYDYQNGYISRRFSPISNNDVIQYYGALDGDVSGDIGVGNIASMQWGNNTKDGQPKGVVGNLVKHGSLLDCVNFTGKLIQDNVVETGAYVAENDFYGNTEIVGNTFNKGVNIRLLHVSGGKISNCTFTEFSTISQLRITDTTFEYNTVSSKSNFNGIEITDSTITNNVFRNTTISSIYSYKLNVNYNTFLTTYLQNIIVPYDIVGTNISYNNTNNGIISGFSATKFNIMFNVINNGGFNLANTASITGKSLQNINVNGATVTTLSGATIIYQDGSFNIDSNISATSTPRLSYINSSNVFTVVNPNA